MMCIVATDHSLLSHAQCMSGALQQAATNYPDVGISLSSGAYHWCILCSLKLDEGELNTASSCRACQEL